MYVFDYGAPVGSVAPEFYELDVAFTRREGYEEAQSDLIYDYHTNVAMYPAFQAYLRGYRPPLLAIWGENDVLCARGREGVFEQFAPRDRALRT